MPNHPLIGTLRVTRCGGHKEDYPISIGNPLKCGRDDQCGVCLKDDLKASRFHCTFELMANALVVRDLESRNGTFVNGRRLLASGGQAELRVPPESGNVPHRQLSSGDVVRIGDTVIEILLQTEHVCRRCNARMVFKFDHTATLPDLCDRCAAAASGQNDQTMEFTPACVRCGGVVTDHAKIAPGADFVCQQCRAAANRDEDRPDVATAPVDANISPAPMLKIPHHTLLKKLGQGGMGVVYKARKVDHTACVAIKVMLSQAASYDADRILFEREIAILKQLDHPNIVRLLDHGVIEGACYFVMELCEGGSAFSWLERFDGHLPMKPAMFMFLQALKGLEYAHKHGVVHRDIKPQNLFLTKVGKGWRVQLGDFGLSKSCELAGYSRFTATGQIGGTLEFMPREQLTNYRRLEPMSDLWSAAASFYYLLTGKTPRDFDKSKDPLQVILNQDAVPIRQRVADFPAPYAAIFDKALSEKIEARYQTASELIVDLRKALNV